MGLGHSCLSPPGAWLNMLHVGLLKGFALDQPVVETLEVSTVLWGTAGGKEGMLVPGHPRRGGAAMGDSLRGHAEMERCVK